MVKTTTIGQYLIDKLIEVGIKDIFGIPGDYVINFFSLLEQNPINIVGTCSEQGAAFAADAYARVNGIGALAITYCVGGLNTVNAVAGAYAEKAPLIVISGAPGLGERNNSYMLHHMVRDVNTQLNIFKEITVASTQLDDPETAIYEIDRVISACLKYKRPVYIEIPRDLIHQECVVPVKKAEIKKVSDKATLEEAISEAKEILNASKKTVILGCIEIQRYGLEKQFLQLLENTGYPYASTILGKSVIDESHPQFIGVYMGKVGKEQVRKHIEEADCVLILGALMTDMNVGTAQLNISKTIYATNDELCIKHHTYKNVNLGDFIERLSQEIKGAPNKENFNTTEETEYIPVKDEPIKANRLFNRLNKFITEDSLVVCDVGDCLFGAVDLTIPKNTMFLGPAFYTSMGYGVPACIGAQITRPDIKPIVLVGDGAFQMTGHEVSCFVKYGLKPIVILVNNKGYTTQRYLKEGSFNDIQSWNYHKITDLVGGGLGLEAFTEDELEDALLQASQNNDSFTIINVHIDKYDKSSTLSRLTGFFEKIINPQQ